MRRTRVTEMAQRQPPARNLRTSTTSSSSDSTRSRNERITKLGEGRSPRGTQSDPPANKKKLGTRIADLESQLGLAQEELKTLKTHIVSVETDKTTAHDQQQQQQEQAVQKETDVFEVPMENVDIKPPPATAEPENPIIDELALKNDEIISLKENVDEKEKQLQVLREENDILKSQVDEKSMKISSAQSEIDELTSKLEKADHELEKSRSNAIEMNEKLEAAEKANEELENEMRMLRVQTEQWRKAADAAASVLAGGVEMNGRRLSERCVSMDKHYGYGFGPIGGYSVADYGGSPGLIDDDEDDDFGSGKKKGSSGIRMFGDLWKKKAPK